MGVTLTGSDVETYGVPVEMDNHPLFDIRWVREFLDQDESWVMSPLRSYEPGLPNRGRRVIAIADMTHEHAANAVRWIAEHGPDILVTIRLAEVKEGLRLPESILEGPVVIGRVSESKLFVALVNRAVADQEACPAPWKRTRKRRTAGRTEW